jgi:hypothetical protein
MGKANGRYVNDPCTDPTAIKVVEPADATEKSYNGARRPILRVQPYKRPVSYCVTHRADEPLAILCIKRNQFDILLMNFQAIQLKKELKQAFQLILKNLYLMVGTRISSFGWYK